MQGKLEDDRKKIETEWDLIRSEHRSLRMAKKEIYG
jgi:hypothetical protein